MRCRTSLNANQARLKRGKEPQDVGSSQPLTNDNSAVVVDTVSLKHILCDIEADPDRGHGDLSLNNAVPPILSEPGSAVAEGVHPIWIRTIGSRLGNSSGLSRGGSLPFLEGFHRRCCDPRDKRDLGKRPLAHQIMRHEGKIAPGVIPLGGAFLKCRGHPGAAFGPECPPSGKQPGTDRLDPLFSRPQRLQKLFYSRAGLEPRGDGIELLLPAD